MFTSDAIIQMAFTTLFLTPVLIIIFSKLSFSSIKIMLLGIGILLFTYTTLRSNVPYGFDDMASILGINIVFAGFFHKESTAK